jgi:hypothetical protein
MDWSCGGKVGCFGFAKTSCIAKHAEKRKGHKDFLYFPCVPCVTIAAIAIQSHFLERPVCSLTNRMKIEVPGYCSSFATTLPGEFQMRIFLKACNESITNIPVMIIIIYLPLQYKNYGQQSATTGSGHFIFTAAAWGDIFNAGLWQNIHHWCWQTVRDVFY